MVGEGLLLRMLVISIVPDLHSAGNGEILGPSVAREEERCTASAASALALEGGAGGEGSEQRL